MMERNSWRRPARCEPISLRTETNGARGVVGVAAVAGAAAATV